MGSKAGRSVAQQRLKLWLGVGTSVLIGAVPASAGGLDPAAPAAQGRALAPSGVSVPHVWRPADERRSVHWQRMLAQASAGGAHAPSMQGGDGGEGGLCALGGEGGERGEHKETSARTGTQGGEGGEGGEAGDAGGDELAFVHSLDERLVACLRLAEGHLRVARALYEQGEFALAQTHFAHPLVELWEGIEHALERPGLPDVEGALKALHQASLQQAPLKALDVHYREARRRLDAAARVVEHEQHEAGPALRIALTVLRQAAHEYGEAERDGTLANPIEYMDAWGFVRAAEGVLARAEADLRKHGAESHRRVLAHLDALKRALPTAVPPRKLVPASQVLGLVSRIELAASGIANVYAGQGGEGGESGQGGEGGAHGKRS